MFDLKPFYDALLASGRIASDVNLAIRVPFNVNIGPDKASGEVTIFVSGKVERSIGPKEADFEEIKN